MTGVGMRFRVLWLAGRMQVSDTLSAGPTVLVTVVQPLLFLLIVLAPRDRSDPVTTTGLVVGAVLTAFWSATVWGAANVLRRDRMVGALPRVVTGQVDPIVTVLGKGIGASVVTITLILVTTVGALVVARVPLAIGAPGWLALGLLGTIVSGTAASLGISVLYVRTRHAQQLASALTYPVFLLGGMMIPVAALPTWLQWVPRLLSMSWLTTFLASLPTGAPDLRALGIALLLTAAYFVVGAVALRTAFAHARRGGGLELY